MRLVSLQIGKPQTFVYRGQEIETGIFKSKVADPLFLSRLNFDGDGQADLEVHGGRDKAVNVYCIEHYPYWEERLGRELDGGAFGENATLQGMTEDTVRIGDIYRLGEAVVQVSQPRQPCHKLAKKHDTADLPLQVQTTGFTGYYFRVLEEGMVAPGTGIELLDRHPAEVTVAFANRVKYRDKTNREAIERLVRVEELSDSWRSSFLKRLAELDS